MGDNGVLTKLSFLALKIYDIIIQIFQYPILPRYILPNSDCIFSMVELVVCLRYAS